MNNINYKTPTYNIQQQYTKAYYSKIKNESENLIKVSTTDALAWI